MKREKLEVLCEQIGANMLKENTSDMMSPVAPLIVPLLKKLYIDSLIGQIADVQPINSPVGKVAALFSTYAGSGSSAETDTHPDSSFLIIIPKPVAALTVDVSTQAIGGDTFTVRYFEDDVDVSGANITRILLSRPLTGTYIPAVGDTFFGKVATYATLNRAAIKKLFKGYGGAFITNGAGKKEYVGYSYGNDDNTQIRFIGFEVRTIDATSASRKLKSKFSQEQLQDLLSVYKEKGIDLFTDSVANEIRQEIDKEFISYLKYIAKPILATVNSTIQLSKSYGAAASGSLQDVSYDLVSNIYLAAEQIVKDTKRNRTIFVMADPVTTSFLQTNAFHTVADPEEKNPYRIGTIGVYPLFCDLFAETGEHYIMVGYLGIDGNGDAGVIYSPYSTTIHTVTDTNFKENVLYMDRYAMTRHPQDTGNIDWDDVWAIENANNSDFFKFFIVDYTTGTVQSPNGVENFGNTSVPYFQ
jgi:Major capsid protein Gp23